MCTHAINVVIPHTCTCTYVCRSHTKPSSTRLRDQDPHIEEVRTYVRTYVVHNKCTYVHVCTHIRTLERKPILCMCVCACNNNKCNVHCTHIHMYVHTYRVDVFYQLVQVLVDLQGVLVLEVRPKGHHYVVGVVENRLVPNSLDEELHSIVHVVVE